jgi:hypothetical protein
MCSTRHCKCDTLSSQSHRCVVHLQSMLIRSITFVSHLQHNLIICQHTKYRILCCFLFILRPGKLAVSVRHLNFTYKVPVSNFGPSTNCLGILCVFFLSALRQMPLFYIQAYLESLRTYRFRFLIC